MEVKFNSYLVYLYNLNSRVTKINLESINHAESLIFPENGGNCINWVLGHIITERDEIFEIIGLPKLCSGEFTKKYKQGSGKLNVSEAENFNELISMFEQTQEILINRLESIELSQSSEIFKKLFFYCFHETYHCGQFGILRRIIGKKGAI